MSVIIPAYNAAPWIGSAISSVIAQTWQHLEVIVIDDGSSDATAEIASSSGDPRVRVLAQANSGAGASRNAGLGVATGEWIQFLDADDLLSPDKIASQLDALSSSPPESVASCAWKRLTLEGVEIDVREQPVWHIANPIDWLVESLRGGGMMHPACWLIPGSVMKAAGSWQESLTLHDDGEMFARVLANSRENVFVPRVLVTYRDVPGSLSRRRSRQAIESAMTVCRARHRIIAGKRDDFAAREAIATQYAKFVYEFHGDAPDLAAEALGIIRQLGVEPTRTVGGPAFARLASAIGFANAVRLRTAAGRIT